MLISPAEHEQSSGSVSKMSTGDVKLRWYIQTIRVITTVTSGTPHDSSRCTGNCTATKRGVSKRTAEAKGLNYNTTRRHIKIAHSDKNVQKIAHNKLRTAQFEKGAEKLIESELTSQQKRFVAEYLIDQNATSAAERAGYSDANYGRQILTIPNVAQDNKNAQNLPKTKRNRRGGNPSPVPYFQPGNQHALKHGREPVENQPSCKYAVCSNSLKVSVS